MITLAVIALVLSLLCYAYYWYTVRQKREFIILAGVGLAMMSGVSLSTIALFLLIAYLVMRMM